MVGPPSRSKVEKTNESNDAYPFYSVGSPFVLFRELNDDIAVLRLSRKEKRDAIDDVILQGIDRFFRALTPSISAVVSRGKGDHFCAGGELSVIAEINASSSLLVEYGGVPVVDARPSLSASKEREFAIGQRLIIRQRSQTLVARLVEPEPDDGGDADHWRSPASRSCRGRHSCESA
jgi:hypothetical protein